MTAALDIPALPVAHARALQMLSQHDASTSDLAATIESDPALTTAVLRAANSAAFAPLTPIRTANDAIVRIGLSLSRRIIAGAALQNSFGSLERAGLDTAELWRHVIACALLASATAWAGGPRTEAFTTGLLHDVGRLAMATNDPVRYAGVAERVRAGTDAREAEVAVFGLDHVEWGMQIGAAWHFADEVVEAIGDHHDGGSGALSWVTWNGREIARRLGIGDGLTPPGDPTLDAESEDGAILDALGGPAGLRAQIEWFRGAAA